MKGNILLFQIHTVYLFKKIKSIKLSKNLIDITENRSKVKKTNLKSYISKPKVNKEIYPLVVIETGSFIIQL